MEPFLGQILIFGGNFAPSGWAFCDGVLLPISQNQALYSLLGTTYGGDGRTTTALPDLQGRTPMHPGRGPGLTARRLGQRGGVETVTLSESQMANHAHGFQGSSDPPDSRQPGNSLAAQPAGRGASALYGTASPTAQDSRTVGSTGGGQAHNNLQPYLAMNFIIALQGLYPSRG